MSKIWWLSVQCETVFGCKFFALSSHVNMNCGISLRRLRSRLHRTFSLLTGFDDLLNSKLPLIFTKMLYTLTVGLLTQHDYEDKARKDADPTSPRACIFAGRPWPFAGKTLIPCDRASNQIEIFPAYNLPEIPTFSLLQSSSILRGES